MTATPLDFLHATLDTVQAEAEAARPGPWAVWNAHHNVAVVHDSGQRSGSGLPLGPLVASANSDHALPDAIHIARHDPNAVLLRIAADRELLADLLAERHHVSGDDWFTCPAATEERDGGTTVDDDRLGKPCDCGRDARVERRVRLIAEGWGWTGET